MLRLTEEDFGPTLYDEWLQWPAHRVAAAQKLGQFIENALLSMPNLHTVRFDIHELMDFQGNADRPIGIAAHVLQAILSVPQLRRIIMNGPLCHPDDDLLPEINPPPSVLLETFDYEVSMLRPTARSTEMDRLGVRLILERAHASLVSLSLPCESAPLDGMHHWQWPMLTTLRLYGERPIEKNTPPLVSALGRMPRLRELFLVLTERTDGKPGPIWPPSIEASYDWRDLERLQVTHPLPDDEFYAHLPASLRRLSLRCWPRFYKYHTRFRKDLEDARVSWTSPLLSSSEMLRILRRSETPGLTHLELEFRADDASDDAIFRHISASYPHLTVLQVHCYRSEGGADPSVERIAHALRGLVNLRLLMLHLDFECLPDVVLLGYRYPERENLLRGQELMEIALEAMASAANVLADTLSASLEYVCLLVPAWRSLQQWQSYRVVRGDDGCIAEAYVPSCWPRTLYGYDIDVDE